MLGAMRLLAAPFRGAHAQSLLGLLLWLLTVALVEPGWSPALLAFGPLVLYPLLFDMIDADGLRRFALLAFLPALASYALQQGDIAGALALPWLAFTLVLFGHRLIPEIRAGRFVIVLIKGYLIVGACWLVLARLGQQPLEYEHAIVHATAVHFHYAGFVLPILALQWVRSAPSRNRYLLFGALLLGVPLVAAGITLSAFKIHWPELAAVWFFVAACVGFAVAQIRFALRSGNRNCRWLLIVSSLMLIAAMSLALLYGTRNYLPSEWVDIPLMLRTHGPIQIFGFALPGVVAWTIAKQNGFHPPFPLR